MLPQHVDRLPPKLIFALTPPLSGCLEEPRELEDRLLKAHHEALIALQVVMLHLIKERVGLLIHSIERVALPQVIGTCLRFLPADAPQRRHRLGFAEPYGRRAWALWSLSVILIPLLGFDRKGNRLGQGGGHYDRALARLRPRRPWLLGIAHDVQEVSAIPTDVWDIPLDGIITPTRTLLINKD